MPKAELPARATDVAVPSASPAVASGVRVFSKQGRIALEFVQNGKSAMAAEVDMSGAIEIACRLYDCVQEVAGEQDKEFRQFLRRTINQNGAAAPRGLAAEAGVTVEARGALPNVSK
jgi:hypothetical protein